MGALREGLTPYEIDNLEPRADGKGYKKADKGSGGLYVYVTPSGAKSWRYKFRLGGKEHVIMLGLYPELGVKAARQEARQAAALVDKGIDPRSQKKLATHKLGEKVFETVARRWAERRIAAAEKAGKPMAPAHAHDLVRSLEVHVFPAIGRVNVDDLDSRHVIDLLDKMAPARAEIVRARLEKIFQFASAMRLRDDSNPAFVAAAVMNEAPAAKKMPALVKLPEVIELLQKVDNAHAYRILKLATRFLALTAARPGMVTGARWDELETDPETGRMVWSVPAERMKTRVPFVSPLSPAAVQIIETMRPISGCFEYIFPSPRNGAKPVARAYIVRLLADIGYKDRHVAHGFRSSFSTIMQEKHPADALALESQLAHVIKGVQGRYNRAAYLARRTELVDEWASMLATTLASPGQVINGKIAAPLKIVRAA